MRHLIAVGLALALTGCSHTIKTGISPVADIENAGGKIEESAHAILVAVQQSNAANPTVVTKDMLTAVALAVNKTGHAGINLGTAIDAYNRLKAAGSDVSIQYAAVQQALQAVTDAALSIGHAIPSGTIQQVDTLLNSILTIIAQVRTATAQSLPKPAGLVLEAAMGGAW